MGQKRAEEKQTQHVEKLNIRRHGRAFKEEAANNRNAAACGILVCIYICGSLLVMAGIAVTCVGVLLPEFRDNKTPWIVTGPTLIIVGVLVLLLSIEIIVKLRRVAPSDDSDSEDEAPRKSKLNGWSQQDVCKQTTNQGALAAESEIPDQLKQSTITVEPTNPVVLDPSSLSN
ncbi:uncharacterized protein LOC111086542 [Limulus polyphemus]|uniref:Uncharacterized protein LOC111086542 n=1 Tax=Limulus polyphemus TaxID=6850 RepID=A0ABM1SP90_LIMPO|nr:uncharacterized protein LOC111086542 [Limulus polyphemus]